MVDRPESDKPARWHLGKLLVAAGLALLLATALASVTLAAAGSTFASNPHGLIVDGNAPVHVAGLMPGDPAITRNLELRAEAPVRYSISVAYSGSPVLAGAMVVTIAGPDGSILYTGRLGEAAQGTPLPAATGLSLGAGEAATIVVTAALPLDAGNETSGQELEYSVVVVSTPDR